MKTEVKWRGKWPKYILLAMSNVVPPLLIVYPTFSIFQKCVYLWKYYLYLIFWVGDEEK